MGRAHLLRSHHRARRRATCLAALGLAVAGLLWAVAVAEAGPARYIYERCDSALPGGGVEGATFTSNPYNPFVPGNTCVEPNGGLSVTQTASSSLLAFWTLPGGVPSGGWMEGLTVTATVCNPGIPNLIVFAFRRDWPGSCQEETRTYREVSPAPLDFYVWLGCDWGTMSCPGGGRISAHYFAITEVDPLPPSVELSGTAFGGDVVRGRQSFGVLGSDRGGGVSRLSLQVNGIPVAPVHQSACAVVHVNNPSVVGPVATTVSPCPSSARAGWTLDTARYPFHNGANAVEACAADFATLGDPNITCTGPRTFTVDNSCAESPVAGGASISAQFARSHSGKETVAYGRAATINGRLTDPTGRPVAGATLCLISRTLGDSSGQATTASLSTDPEGRYSYRVAPGPNRQITISYRSDRYQVSRGLRLNSRVEATLRARPRRLRNRKRVRFRGRLPGPFADGRVVVLQAGVTGSKRWLTFRRATTGPRGGFRATYQFVATRRKTRYRFRAVVPRQSGYPWAGGQSDPVRVLVRP